MTSFGVDQTAPTPSPNPVTTLPPIEMYIAAAAAAIIIAIAIGFAITIIVDREILRCLFEAGSSGLLPRDLAGRLSEFKVTRHQISRRILRMNKRLEKEFGESAAEKRGWHWALTSFAVEV